MAEQALAVSHPVLSDDRAIRWQGLALVLVVFGGFGTWASLAPLHSAALAPGVITVEHYRKTVQHLEGGIIRTLAVHDGDAVQQGQVLATLDETHARAQLEVLRGQLYSRVAQEARLTAQRDRLPVVQYPHDLLAHHTDPRAQDAMRVQDLTFQARRTAQEGERAVYRRQIEQLRAKVTGLQAQRYSKDRLVESYRSDVADFTMLLKEGFTEKQKVEELNRALAQSEGHRGQLVSEMAASELQIAEIELKILQLHKDLQREVAKELSEVQADLFGLREKVQALERTVDRTVITAPVSGMVLGLTLHTIGAVIPPGGRLLDIVPHHQKLIIEAQVAPIDIDRVTVGQVAEVRFSAFKTRDLPMIEGRLISVSADRLVRDLKENNGGDSAYYLARVEVSPDGLQALRAADLALVPGMPAEVLIQTGSRTLLQYVMKPLTDTFKRALIEE
ncbi:HlyD-family type I secretion protein [Candidatus Nitrospira nitrosa]|uniref:HlyD-family type I secretion protein n=1 Tax=Candidatus Nitrospira nitrosa TaxID=1742972 RepID=A0A0S4LA63_9BACT|nr:HlyD family type I secretion periplasmic adaptor subunit [Candidatus Nitrospira nitrosa]CUS33690.1 HlyD-family type I secretion protein [Candidatus Nitrospira nitrosa]